MELAYKRLGQGDPLIILHGLYGSSDNWYTIGKKLAEKYEVYLVDQRNHGLSPHSETHQYNDLVHDLLVFASHHNLDRITLLGHSMGGKTAMYFALRYPQLVQKLLAVDISPLSYLHLTEPSPQITMHLNIVNALLGLDLRNYDSREDIDAALSESLPSERIRQFLTKNIKRDPVTGFFWQINLRTLVRELPSIMGGMNFEEVIDAEPSPVPSLLIRGEQSEYVGEVDIKSFRKLFPQSEVITIEGAGHWVHAERPDLFLEHIWQFIG